jgi:hypothetical protein
MLLPRLRSGSAVGVTMDRTPVDTRSDNAGVSELVHRDRRIVLDFVALSNWRTADDAAEVERRLTAAMAELRVVLLDRSAQKRLDTSRSSPPVSVEDTATQSESHPSGAESPMSRQPFHDVALPETVHEPPTDTEQILDYVIEARPAPAAADDDSDLLFLKPHPTLIDASGEPLLPSQMLHELTTKKWWPAVLCVCAAAGVGLSTAVVSLENEIVRSSLYMLGFLLLLVPLGINTLTYGRAVTSLIVTGTFEFWYLSLQILVFSVCETLQVLDAGISPVIAVLPRLFLTGLAMVGLLCIDASRLSRVAKGLIMLVGAFLFTGLGATWRLNSPIGDKEISVVVFTTTVGSLATSSYMTLGIFCGKFALQALLLKRSIVLITFSWIQDQVTLRRARVSPPPLLRSADSAATINSERTELKDL